MISPPFDAQLLQTHAPDDCLDTINLNCPLPLLKLKVALKGIDTGQTLYLVASDPHSQTDISRYCEKSKLNLDVMQQIDTNFHFIITK